MRFDTPIYFQCVQAGKLDENTHNYGKDTVIETKVYANVSTTATETLKIVYGDIKQNSLTIRLQMPYKNVFDRIKVGEKFYKVDSAKQLRNKQVFVVSEVQGSFTGDTASGATYKDGYKDGFTDGETQGYNNGVAVGEQQGYAKGETDGRQAEYDEFWDSFQENGNRTNYACSFGSGWNKEKFKPKYDLRPTYMYMMFHNNFAYNWGIGDFVVFCDDLGIVFDTSKSTNFQYAFSALGATRLGVIDTTSANSLATQVFFGCGKLETIDELIVKETQSFNDYTFGGCSSLKNIKISGVIGNSFYIQSSPLTAESAISVINALKDYSGTDKEYTCKVSFSSTAKANLNALGNTAPNGLTWLEYAKAKGWNI